MPFQGVSGLNRNNRGGGGLQKDTHPVAVLSSEAHSILKLVSPKSAPFPNFSLCFVRCVFWRKNLNSGGSRTTFWGVSHRSPHLFLFLNSLERSSYVRGQSILRRKAVGASKQPHLEKTHWQIRPQQQHQQVGEIRVLLGRLEVWAIAV